MMKLLGLLFVFLLSSSVVQSSDDLPQAYLSVDGKKYAMVPGSYCWASLCLSSIANITQRIPVPVNSESKLELVFKSQSQISQAFLYSQNTNLFIEFTWPVKGGEEQQAKTREFNRNNTSWQVNPEKETDYYIAFAKARHKLKPVMQQAIPTKYDPGQYILSVGSWWSGGSIFFALLVESKPKTKQPVKP